MRKHWLSSLAMAVLLAAGSRALAAGEFEGVVAYKLTTSNGKTMDVEYQVKGKKIRSDMKHGDMEMSVIMDTGGKKMTTLMHKQKMYSVHTLDNSFAGTDKDFEGKFYKASGSKTILGYNCEHWVYEGKSGKGDFWLAKGIGAFAAFSGSSSGSAKAEEWVKAVKAKGLFALEVDFTSKDGKTMTMVATKVKKLSLSEGLFKVPPGYKEMPSWDGAAGSKTKKPSADDVLKGMKPKLPF